MITRAFRRSLQAVRRLSEEGPGTGLSFAGVLVMRYRFRRHRSYGYGYGLHVGRLCCAHSRDNDRERKLARQPLHVPQVDPGGLGVGAEQNCCLRQGPFGFPSSHGGRRHGARRRAG